MKKYFKIDNSNKIIQVQYYYEDGFIEDLSGTAICGMYYENEEFVVRKDINVVKNRKIQELKSIRDNKVNEIKITLSTGEYLDGNELAQTRMSRAIQALPDDDTELDWIDANNNTIKLTKPKFSEALVLAGQEQTNIFTTYNTLREQVNNATTIDDIEAIVWEE